VLGVLVCLQTLKPAEQAFMLGLPKGNSMEIVIEIKSVYGVEKFYPICDKAKLFAHIANTKTLTPEVLVDITKLGYQVTLHQQDMLSFLKETK
jgi:hypothetical protein